MKPTTRKVLIGTAVLMMLFSLIAVAQERTGAVQGTVTDPTGSAVPGATVELSGGSLIRPASLTTDGAGAYLFPSIPPGEYMMSVQAKGFATIKRSAIPVQVGRTARIDIRLEVGQVSESVVVEAAGLVVDTATNVVATNIDASVYDRLPKGRNFDSLILLSPGVRSEPKSGGYQVDGASGSENVYVVDGVEVTNFQTGVLDRQTRIPIEWVGETNVKNSGVDAQFGGALGGVVSANTKSGSNDFHGRVSLYMFNDAMNAGPRDTLRLVPTNDNRFEYFDNKEDGYKGWNPGYELGGRLIRDKVWFYSSYYPQFDKYTRNVNFTTGQTGTYESKERQDFWLNRLDYMPFQKLRLTGSYQYNPFKQNGLLPSRLGTDAFSTPWADRGNRRPYTQYNYQGDYTISSKAVLSVFGGYTYKNYKDYGIPGGTRYVYSTPSIGTPGVPAELQRGSGAITPDNRQWVQDIFERNNINANFSYLFNAKGQHNFKAGWQLNRLQNRPFGNTWADGYIQFYWNRAYNAITKPGSFRGQYGYYRVIPFITQGDVASNNQAFYFNDSWRVSKTLQITAGVRFEKEYVPSFANPALGLPSKAITFNFSDKASPRVGFAWDPSGVGKMKLYGGWGWYFDTMKYELPRGSFGGDFWIDRYYTLDTFNYQDIKPTPGSAGVTGTFPGTLIESLNRRIPSNDPSEGLIPNDLKPVRLTALDLGYEYSVTDKIVLGARYSRKRLDRTIEDVGILTSLGEQYYIANPGYGPTVDESIWPKGYPTDVTPKARRDYDALELRMEKRYSSAGWINVSYTWSRLYGNYGGLASSDESLNTTAAGRTSPNVNRYFDLPWISYDAKGSQVFGRLATDRPHTLKAFYSYDLRTKAGTTRFSPIFQVYSGTPLTTEVDVQDLNVFSFGRGDLGRTPIFSQADLMIVHDFRGFKEGQKFRFEFNATNLFNQATVIGTFGQITHTNDGAITFANTADIFKGYDVRRQMASQDVRVDPRYGLDYAYQGPRELRLGFHFIF